MRDILFRGQALCKGGRWIYGNLITNQSVTSYIIDSNIAPSKIGNSYVEVVHVGQYTGLKDKNGTKIFEGDIISVRGKYPKVVKFIDEYACYCLANIEDLYNDLCSPWQQVRCGWWRDRQEYIEIIGNVYDNKNDYEK